MWKTYRHLTIGVLLVVVTLPAGGASMRRIGRFFLRQPNATEPPPSKLELPLDQALVWRALGMRDEHGLIRVGAAYLANVFRRQALLGVLPTPIVRPLSVQEVQTMSVLAPSSWTSRGPSNVGGRTRSLLIKDAMTMYAGAVSGGVWKTTNGGSSWTPLTDFMSNIAISTMTFDPSVADRSVLYAGTGELEYFRGDGVQGAGVFKTSNAGVNWSQLASTATWKTVSRLAMNTSVSCWPPRAMASIGRLMAATRGHRHSSPHSTGLASLSRSTRMTQRGIDASA